MGNKLEQQLSVESMRQIDSAKRRFAEACAEYHHVVDRCRIGEADDDDYTQALVEKQKAYEELHEMQVLASTLSQK